MGRSRDSFAGGREGRPLKSLFSRRLISSEAIEGESRKSPDNLLYSTIYFMQKKDLCQAQHSV